MAQDFTLNFLFVALRWISCSNPKMLYLGTWLNQRHLWKIDCLKKN